MENIEVGEWIINQNRLVIGQIIGINEERQEATKLLYSRNGVKDERNKI